MSDRKRRKTNPLSERRFRRPAPARSRFKREAKVETSLSEREVFQASANRAVKSVAQNGLGEESLLTEPGRSVTLCVSPQLAASAVVAGRGAMKVIKRHLSPATVIALLALFVALAGTGVAATGGNFILGQSNSATSQTGLAGTTSAAALAVANIGGGVPLKLTGPSTQPPLVVNSATKVSLLNADELDGKDKTDFYAAGSKVANADLLDGKDSTAFTQGRGNNSWGGAGVAYGNTAVFAGASAPRAYTLSYECPQKGVTTAGHWLVKNTSSTDSFLLFTSAGTPKGGTAPADDALRFNPGDSFAFTSSNQAQMRTLQLFWGGNKMTTIIAASIHPLETLDCQVQVHVITAGA
jgi:hypothetical protein